LKSRVAMLGEIDEMFFTYFNASKPEDTEVG